VIVFILITFTSCVIPLGKLKFMIIN